MAWRETVEQLAARFEAERDGRRKRRLRALVLVRRGEGIEAVAATVGVSARTVHRWLARYRRGGLDEVLGAGSGQRARGRNPRLTPEQIAALVARAESGAFATVGDAVAWVGATWGIVYTYQGMYALLSRASGAAQRATPWAEQEDP